MKTYNKYQNLESTFINRRIKTVDNLISKISILNDTIKKQKTRDYYKEIQKKKNETMKYFEDIKRRKEETLEYYKTKYKNKLK